MVCTEMFLPFQIDEMKQAAADVLFHYSLFTMTCIGEGVRPAQLRMHLMKVLFVLLSKSCLVMDPFFIQKDQDKDIWGNN